MPAITLERQELQQMIPTLPDDSISVILDFAKNLKPRVPNSETREAMAELRAGKGEKVTIDQIMAELNAGN